MNICCVVSELLAWISVVQKLYDPNIPWEASQVHTEQNFISFQFKQY